MVVLGIRNREGPKVITLGFLPRVTRDKAKSQFRGETQGDTGLKAAARPLFESGALREPRLEVPFGGHHHLYALKLWGRGGRTRGNNMDGKERETKAPVPRLPTL